MQPIILFNQTTIKLQKPSILLINTISFPSKFWTKFHERFVLPFYINVSVYFNNKVLSVVIDAGFEGGDIAENIFMCDSKQTYMYNWPYQESDEYLRRSS